MQEGESDDASRKTAIEVMTMFFLEERQAARHQEGQRSTVSTIIVSLATAALGLTGVLWNRAGALDSTTLPFTITIALLGAFGYLVTTKLFERSMSHFSLSEAYRQTIQALAAPDLHKHLPPGEHATLQLPYVRDAAGKAGFEVTGHKLNKKGKESTISTEGHDALDPRPIVVPRHNKNARFLGCAFATVRLYALWAWLFIGILSIGIVLSLAAFANAYERRGQSANLRSSQSLEVVDSLER